MAACRSFRLWFLYSVTHVLNGCHFSSQIALVEKTVLQCRRFLAPLEMTTRQKKIDRVLMNDHVHADEDQQQGKSALHDSLGEAPRHPNTQ
jgi:hypothetical protein